MPRTRLVAVWSLLLLLAGADPFAQDAAPYQVSGRVVTSTGESRPGATVCAYPIDRGPSFGALCAPSGPDGTFIVRARVAGRYLVMAQDVAAGHYPSVRPFYRVPGQAVTEVVLDEAHPKLSAEVTLGPRNGTLVARVHDGETNWPIDTVRLILCHVEEPDVCFLADGRSDEGVFMVAAAHVPFTVRVWAREYQVWSGPAPVAVASGQTTYLDIGLARRPEFAGKPVNEREKIAGVHLSAPELRAPADGAVLTQFPRTMTLAWEPVKGAVWYAVDVDYCVPAPGTSECIDPVPLYRETPPMIGITGTTYGLTFIGSQPGRWRVWAVDQQGRAGFKSRWRTFVFRP